MQLTLLYDHRFYRSADGIVFSAQNYNYTLFARRYLSVFERITILARIIDDHDQIRQGRFTEGDGVSVVPIGNWRGPIRFVLQQNRVLERLRNNIQPKSAVIMVVPGVLGTMAYANFCKSRPYGVEVIGDPYDVFAPHANNHPLRVLFRWWFARNLKRQCAGAVTAAYVTANALQQRYPPGPEAFTTHYSSIELTSEAFVDVPPVERVGRAKETFLLVHVGTMAQLYKAQDDLIYAVYFCVKNDFDVHLVLVGDGKHRVELEALAERLGLFGRVSFVGHLPAGDAVRQQLDQADLFVMPSRQEGLPRAMIEAMARGLPCIGTSIGGIPELLEAENLVPVNDRGALSQKIQEVLSNSERRKQMAERNLRVSGQYRAEILQARRETLYTHLKEKTAEWIQQTE
jgi:glycosyltransferase involved in cell wall biosynthesis